MIPAEIWDKVLTPPWTDMRGTYTTYIREPTGALTSVHYTGLGWYATGVYQIVFYSQYIYTEKDALKEWVVMTSRKDPDKSNVFGRWPDNIRCETSAVRLGFPGEPEVPPKLSDPVKIGTHMIDPEDA